VAGVEAELGSKYWTRTMKGNPPAGTEWRMPLPRTLYEPLGRAASPAFTRSSPLVL